MMTDRQKRFLWAKKQQQKGGVKQTPAVQQRTHVSVFADDMGMSPILQDGLEQLNRAAVHAKAKVDEYDAFAKSLRPVKGQTTLHENATKASSYDKFRKGEDLK